MKKQLGGDRLGSGNKLSVEMHGYARSTHDLGYLWRSTMAAGTLVPFMKELALPGDTFDINLGCEVMTHPTIGPLFGSFKVQLDVFQAPIRLYQGQLHNNKLGIGNNMAQVKLPIIVLPTTIDGTETDITDLDNAQINPSCVLAYLGIRGVGINWLGTPTPQVRQFNAIPLLAYWDIYKNYYANKQEEIGAVIHTEQVQNEEVVGQVGILQATGGAANPIAQAPAEGVTAATQNDTFEVTYPASIPRPVMNQIMVKDEDGVIKNLDEWGGNWIFDDVAKIATGRFKWEQWGNRVFAHWRYRTLTEIATIAPRIETFPLENIDTMREEILAAAPNLNQQFNVNTIDISPYNLVLQTVPGAPANMLGTQEGLALKTYQSDMFNNWMNTEWIDGVDGIGAITAVDTSSGEFQIDALILARKVYDMLNRIAISGGSYNDWLDAVYDEERIQQAETPMYMGGLIKELVFQEVVSNSGSGEEGQPLGTLAGKGTLAKKHKGGSITIKVKEPSYIIGLISLTPRIDYSQGNDWDTHLLTMDDLHKPGLDEIGFQELVLEDMAWWDARYGAPGQWGNRSAGKQPAWLNYMTRVNKTYGNFAIKDNEMFMTLNRRYEYDPLDLTAGIIDVTTYIDPVKYNQIFAQTALDAQNFWVQIAVDNTARRKMSAKLMPNL